MPTKNPSFNRFVPGLGFLGPTHSVKTEITAHIPKKRWGDSEQCKASFVDNGSGISLDPGTPAVAPVNTIFTGIAYLRKLAAHRRRIKKEEARLRDEAPPKEHIPAKMVLFLPGTGIDGKRRKWDTLKICACSGCNKTLLGESDERFVRMVWLSEPKRYRRHLRKLPPPVALRTIDGRPFCEQCVKAKKA